MMAPVAKKTSKPVAKKAAKKKAAKPVKKNAKKPTQENGKPIAKNKNAGNRPSAGQRSTLQPVSTNGAPTDSAAGAPPAFEVYGTNAAALFTLKIYRGEGMALLAMNWKNGEPPSNFVGFAIEYKEPGSNQFFALKNRLSFLADDGNINPNIKSSRLSPIQKFRWVHFPFHADLPGDYVYRVYPVFMDKQKQLSYGDFQEAAIQLQSETYPGKLNIAFTRGFIASQAFVDHFGENGGVGTIIPEDADKGLDFVPTDPKAAQALTWMGFEARQIILDSLDKAIADETAQVRVTAYDCNMPEIVKDRLVRLGSRLKIIIDDSDKHGNNDSPETETATLLSASAGAANVQRQKVGGLQHNKTIAVMGDEVNLAIGGSTNFSWRGFYVQNNNAVLGYGQHFARLFFDQFENLWDNQNSPAGFAATDSAEWNDLKIPGVEGKVSFSPHSDTNAVLDSIGEDIKTTQSSLLYSLAFLYQTPGTIRTAIKSIVSNDNLFVYGLSDKTVGDLDLQKPDGNPPVVFPGALLKNVPEPFKTEASGGSGVRMHHKFVVIDFDKPTARVYMGSYNFSVAADTKNGENLFCFKDRRIAVSYMVEAVVMFDHYEFRNKQAQSPLEKLYLKEPPASQDEVSWFAEDFSQPAKVRDRLMFSA